MHKFQNRVPIWPLVDEILEPVDLLRTVLRYLHGDILAVSPRNTLNQFEIKQVARIVRKALAALHEDVYVHTDQHKLLSVSKLTLIILDIKPNNVLCIYKQDEDGSEIRFSEVLLVGFGSCIHSSSDMQSKEN